jgi:CHAD domain-containing protein
MNSQFGPDRVIARRLRALADALPAAFEGDVAGVHKARVASRRVREALPVLLVHAPAKRGRKLRRAFRRVTQALGPVRETDVTLDLVRDLKAEAPETSDALVAVTRELHAERQHRHERMIAELDDVDFEQLVERIGAAMHEVPEDLDDSATVQAAVSAGLAIRAARRTRQLRTAIESAGSLYAPEPIHVVRIAVKKLRYVLELAHELKLLRTQRFVARLKACQETLGSMHDAQVLIEQIARVQATLPPDAAPGTIDRLDEVRDRLETRCRELHARYLAQRERLVMDAEVALDQLTTALPTHGAPAPVPMTVH